MRYVKRPPAKASSSQSHPDQGTLALRVAMQDEIDGIGMGVLSDGTPFLNQRGLARMCGVQNAHIGTISSEWGDDSKPRIAAIKKILADRGIVVSSPHLVVSYGGRQMFAYTDDFCLAVLEYYAFDAGQNIQPEATRRYRWLAGRSLREIIYTQLGVKAPTGASRTWQQFYDRVSLVYDSVPAGHFCIFKEIATLMVTLINSGAKVGDTFVPDISVGRAWAKHWSAIEGEARFGVKGQFCHSYPEYFPQAASNPQMANCYPDAALAEFRRWLREEYLPRQLPEYLSSKVRKGLIPQEAAAGVVAALAPPAPRLN